MKINYFLNLTFIIILAACIPAPATNLPESTVRPAIITPRPSSATPELPLPTLATINEAKILNSREIPPYGVLDQIAWGGQGGGERAIDWYVPTSNCTNCDVDFGSEKIVFSGFKPNQKIIVPIYENAGVNACGASLANYLTSFSFLVDSKGYGEVQLTGDTEQWGVTSGVYDYQTGNLLVELNVSMVSADCSKTISSAGSCPGAPLQRLEVGGSAYVCTAGDTVKLREGPGKNYSILKSLIPGAELEVIGGPQCADNWSWWQVETESGYTGWMAEGGDRIDPYFLCPQE